MSTTILLILNCSPPVLVFKMMCVELHIIPVLLITFQEAAKLGKRVAVCDFVKATPKGTTWGKYLATFFFSR